MSDIRIYVCCHKLSPVAEHPLLFPIQVGAALAETHFDAWEHDDSGENISIKNRSYCELTAQYWAWKNSSADYFGFFHYRRYLYPDINAKLPYIICKEPDLQQLKYDSFAELINRYDIIAPIPEDMHVSAREHYKNAPHHRYEDLSLAEQILREKYPEYLPAMEAYLGGRRLFFGNIFIMKQDIYQDYCQWLFSILDEFDIRADWSGRGVQELRVDGYLAERLFGVYITKHAPWLNILYLPRAHFEPDDIKRIKLCALNKILPPGSKARATVKGMFRTQ